MLGSAYTRSSVAFAWLGMYFLKRAIHAHATLLRVCALPYMPAACCCCHFNRDCLFIVWQCVDDTLSWQSGWASPWRPRHVCVTQYIPNHYITTTERWTAPHIASVPVLQTQQNRPQRPYVLLYPDVTASDLFTVSIFLPKKTGIYHWIIIVYEHSKTYV